MLNKNTSQIIASSIEHAHKQTSITYTKDMFYTRPYILTHKNKILDLSTPKIMAILNITPDSFSDGGAFNEVDAALLQCQKLVKDGAHIIDIGAESTRPNAKPIDSNTQITRLQHILPKIIAQRDAHWSNVWISIDTSCPKVMQWAHHLGADIWNDVRALSMAGAKTMAKQLDCPVVIMHHRGTSSTMDKLCDYTNIEQILDELLQKVNDAKNAGIKKQNIIIDIGMGFAKDFAMHKNIMQQYQKITKLDYPVLFGVSRKRFVMQIIENHTVLQQYFLQKNHGDALSNNTVNHADDIIKQNALKDSISQNLDLIALLSGTHIIRTHNALKASQTLALFNALSTQQ